MGRLPQFEIETGSRDISGDDEVELLELAEH